MPGRPIENHSNAVKYLGVDDFLDVLKTGHQILKFKSVPEKAFEILSGDDTRPCKFVRLQYHRPTQLLLVKITPGWDHENLIFLVRKLIDRQLNAMNLFSSNKPTCAVEIGTSESTSHLSADAYGWLEAPQSPVKAVITISFKYLCAETDENPLSISVWKPGRRLSSHDTGTNLSTAIRTAHIDVWNVAGSLSVSGFSHDVDTQLPVSADEIQLPLELLIGRLPSHPREHDIVITQDMLLWILHQLWEYRRQRVILQ
ncbi:hypothetical protein N7517_004611 [Penicillium concentricum]|uniref:Uncharacterized protein n=1 Tax=Penicillium concentricum TaxID=293559 RepID=A0A9W9S673_9EURO|nr:uncharacterized protein N7517_004611 [Penicillium concentricum]KAJ5372605.1 hypothetical protein N7517_004611 [Penicillium concentricum]